MALGPLTSIGAAPSAPSGARDVTSAQRAFFQAALTQVAPVAPRAPMAAVPAPPPEPAKPAAAAEAPKSGYRPGSLLDLKI